MSNLGNKDILAQNLKRLMRIKNVDRNTMCDDLKLKYSTVSEWLSAKTSHSAPIQNRRVYVILRRYGGFVLFELY